MTHATQPMENNPCTPTQQRENAMREALSIAWQAATDKVLEAFKDVDPPTQLNHVNHLLENALASSIIQNAADPWHALGKLTFNLTHQIEKGITTHE